jgi:hypothetical protein
MRTLGPRESLLGNNKLGARKDEAQSLPLLKGSHQSARMIEVKVAEKDDIDVFRPQPDPREGLQKNVLHFNYPIALPESGLEKRPHAGFDQDPSPFAFHQKGARCELNSAQFVRRAPLLPESSRYVAEHCPTIKRL